MRLLTPGVRAGVGGLCIAVLLAVSAAPAAAAGYVNPFASSGYSIGRTDMGVDVCLSAGDPIGAVGDAQIVGVERNWYENQPFIWYELTDGPDAGRYVYVAEQITDLARVGQVLRAGQPVARFAKQGTCIETGWGTQDGETLAQATTGYHEGQVTPAGVSFARFLMATGVQGSFELSPTTTGSGRPPAPTPKPKPKPVPKPKPTSKPKPVKKPVEKPKPTSKPQPSPPAKPSGGAGTGGGWDTPGGGWNSGGVGSGG